MSTKLSSFFENFLSKESLFSDKKVLQSTYVPDEIEHRDEQLTKIAQMLAPSLKLERPSNIFIYGKTGTGKTLSVRYITDQLKAVSKKKNIPLKIIHINCKLKKIADTEYRLIAELARFFGKEIPATGLPTDQIYNTFFSALDSQKQLVILVLDEIDMLVRKTGDDVLYNLTRINQELKNSEISILGISNDLLFSANLHPQVKSSLSEEEIIFPPYNAIQIQDILRKRSVHAFKAGVVAEGVLEKCAAFAAREHGDARRALELLRVAGEIAEREGSLTLEIKHLDVAEEKIDKDTLLEMVRMQPKQFKSTLYSIMVMAENNKKIDFTGDVYELYKNICVQTGLRPLTQRRISDIVAELDMLGIINAKVISKGRFGRTREINLSIPSYLEGVLKKSLEADLDLAH
jgi:archaeal cell division control protein 6